MDWHVASEGGRMTTRDLLLSGDISYVGVIGQKVITTVGSSAWVCPVGVTSVSVVVVGCGIGGGAGGALSYLNNYTVIPGDSYVVFISSGSAASYFVNLSTVSAGNAANRITLSGGGGDGGVGIGSGAGGYSGAGGSAPATYGSGNNGSGGGGGSGGASRYSLSFGGASLIYGGGGGVGLLGQGSNGAGGSGDSSVGDGVNETDIAYGGNGGSMGASGGTSRRVISAGNVTENVAGLGGNYGGAVGNGAGDDAISASAIRIIWPGSGRRFPSTNTGNL